MGDTIVYAGPQDMKVTLTEAKVMRVCFWGESITVKPTRSSNPLRQPSGKLVTLRLPRKICILRRKR